MNAQRRKQIVKAAGLIAEARNILENVMNDETEAYENLPETFQNGTQGETMQDYISALEDAIAQLEEAEAVTENCNC